MTSRLLRFRLKTSPPAPLPPRFGRPPGLLNFE